MSKLVFRTLACASAALALVACKPKEEVAQQPDANPVATVPTPANEAAPGDFVMKAATSDMFEIESSKIALQRTKNAEVKAFAQMMIDQHMKSTTDLKAAIASSGEAITPPAALPQDKMDALEQLRNAAPADFDKNYLNAQVDGHQAALDLMQRQANDGTNPAIKAFAAATAAVVQGHYDHVKALRDKMAG